MFRFSRDFRPEDLARVTSTKPPRRPRRGLKPRIEPMEARLVLSTFVEPAGSPDDASFTIPENQPGDNQYIIEAGTNSATFVLTLPAGSTVTLTGQTPGSSYPGFYVDAVNAPDGTDLTPIVVLGGNAGVGVPSESFQTSIAGSYSIVTDTGGFENPFTLVVTVPTVATPVVTFSSPDSALPITTNLMSEVPFHVAVSPASPAPSQYGIQIEGQGIAPQGWTDVATSSSPDFKVTERLAGKLAIRAFVEIGGVRYYSDQSSETVLFPKIGQIATEPAVIAATNQAWLDTLNFTKHHHKQEEEGFWITLDTATGAYSHSPIIPGPVLAGTARKGGEVDLISHKPADVYDPTSLSSIYVVASFHTHTPAVYVPLVVPPRTAGPSGDDDSISINIGIPGLVYDYKGRAGKVSPGTPLKAPAELYFTPNDSLFGLGTTRRNLPGTSGGGQ